MYILKKYLKVFVLCGLGVAVNSCAELTDDLEVRLCYPTGSVVPDLLYDGENFSSDVTARVVYSYDAIGGRQRIDPPSAFPTRIIDENGTETAQWHLSDSPGKSLRINPSANLAELIGGKVPYNQTGLWIAIEFMKNFTVDNETKTMVVAYGCLNAPAGVKITKAGLKSLLSNGIAIFAGRTCGQCSPSIDEADFSQCDHPEFTATKLASAAPLACQAYDGMSCAPVEISELTCTE